MIDFKTRIYSYTENIRRFAMYDLANRRLKQEDIDQIFDYCTQLEKISNKSDPNVKRYKKEKKIVNEGSEGKCETNS